MRKVLSSSRHASLLTSFLLALLLFRAYVPAGFMPASGTPFLLELCPAAAPMPMTGHHHHHSDTSHTEFQSCPFGSAPAGGPIAHFVAFVLPAPIVSEVFTAFEPLRLSARLELAHRPRGPPSSLT